MVHVIMWIEGANIGLKTTPISKRRRRRKKTTLLFFSYIILSIVFFFFLFDRFNAYYKKQQVIN
jgi:hypothetical protein